MAYPMGERTVIWCSPALAPRLATLVRNAAISNDDFAQEAAELGGTFSGQGRFRLLLSPPHDIDSGTADLQVLSRDNPADCALIQDFIDACPEADLDEAELEMGDLDPVILVTLDQQGAISAYASTRPWDVNPNFDDVGILTRPDTRSQGLGTAAVAALARQQLAAGRVPLYNCNVDNLGSNRLAEVVGFELVQTVSAVRFD